MHQQQKMAVRHHEYMSGLRQQQVGQGLAPMFAKIGALFARNQDCFRCCRQTKSGRQACRTHQKAPFGQFRYRTALRERQLAFAERFSQRTAAGIARAQN